VATSHFVLLIENDPSESEALARQLIHLGVEPIRVGNLAEAMDVMKSKAYSIRAILLPSHLDSRLVQKALKSMRRREPVLPALVYGKLPEPRQRKALRQCGVLLALWDGYDEGMLRFQLNRMISGDGPQSPRKSRRAPIHSPVRVLVGGREKEGVLYSLSGGGCFVETPRASMDGARLRLFFELPGHETEVEGEGVVVFANVPGNLQRPNLPLGMGIRFEELSRESRATIDRFIRERLSALDV
jgi:uncharacterized protein (TIGR02266 family)